MKKFNLEKNIWTQAYFEIMGWHDSTIYGMALKNYDDFLMVEIVFDIDYLFKWIHPEPPEQSFSFWISPCTLVFKRVFNLMINIQAGAESAFELEVADIHRLAQTELMDGVPQWEWHIELQQGEIRFEAKGYDQIVRQRPIFLNGQQIPENLRGEINFGRIPC